MSDPLELISVYQGANVTEAHLVKNLLLAEEINAVVSEEHEVLPSGQQFVDGGLLADQPDRRAHFR